MLALAVFDGVPGAIIKSAIPKQYEILNVDCPILLNSNKAIRLPKPVLLNAFANNVAITTNQISGLSKSCKAAAKGSLDDPV